jgi:hypothetical protein
MTYSKEATIKILAMATVLVSTLASFTVIGATTADAEPAAFKCLRGCDVKHRRCMIETHNRVECDRRMWRCNTVCRGIIIERPRLGHSHRGLDYVKGVDAVPT